MTQTADALAFLRKRGIIHGDLKANNILVDTKQNAQLCDFGLGELMNGRAIATLVGAGAARWHAPEIMDGGRKSFESDVYAFGITIAEVRYLNLGGFFL